jgi:hypothetical protein
LEEFWIPIRCAGTKHLENECQIKEDGMKSFEFYRRAMVLGFIFLAIFLSGIFAISYADYVETIPLYRSPVCGIQPSPLQQNYIVREVPNAIGTLLLFTGGDGRLNLNVIEGPNSDTSNSQFGINKSANFLVRSRHLFASFGFNIAVMDAAEDFYDCQNGLAGWRLSQQHLGDIMAVIQSLREKFPGKPVWVVGTSSGSISAALAATAIIGGPHGADGLVLTSSVTVADENVLMAHLESITLPTLIVSNGQDACLATPPIDAWKIKNRLSSAPIVNIRILLGGFTPLSSECDALSYHGFFGIEPIAAAQISAWIKNHIAP